MKLSRNMKKRLLCGFVCAVVLFIIMMAPQSNIIQRIPFFDQGGSSVRCYDEIAISEDIRDFNPHLDIDRLLPGKNIFFHETSCFGEEGLTLNARQACAVESAARMNPSMAVYLLFISNSDFSNITRKFVKQLLKNYSNIKVRHIYPEKYVKNTPLETLYASGVVKKSHWPTSHMSDLLRYLTLWKYGGIYLDLDVVVTSSLENLTNFAGAEDWEDVAAGVIGLDMSELGRRVADACIQDFKKNFRGDLWGNNGPGVITRTLQELCTAKYARDMASSYCHGFTVYSPSIFYPIHYKKWKKYFELEDSIETMKILDKAKAIHVWNKLSNAAQVHVNSNVPYAIIARNYCPHIFGNCGKVF